jgi:antitoxin component of RelBE/YafQ-DinJ toxin-antitoxin module
MKFHDARIETRVEREIKDKFATIAKEKHMTPSELNRLIIIQYVMGKIELKAV